MPTAVEYKPAGESQPDPSQDPSINPGPVQNPAVQPGPIQGPTGGVKPAGYFSRLATWGMFVGGVSVALIALLLLGPASLPGGLFQSLMGDDSWGTLGCSVPAVQIADGSVVPVSMGGPDGQPVPEDGKQIPNDGDDQPSPLAGLALSLNGLRLQLGSESFAPPNPCIDPPPKPLDGDPIPTDDPPETDLDWLPDYGDGPHIPDPNTCIAIVGDGVCTECENTDTDSDACVCNMDSVCDSQEGFNCPDCQPTPIPPADNVDDKDKKEKPADKDAKPCAVGFACP